LSSVSYCYGARKVEHACFAHVEQSKRLALIIAEKGGHVERLFKCSSIQPLSTVMGLYTI